MAKTNNGFTLIETAVVLVIFGLIASAAFSFINAQLQQSRINSTKTKQEAIKIALTNFVALNNRLPCPAVANLAPGAVGFGVEANAQTQPQAPKCAGISPVNNVVSGIVPFISLGLTNEAGSDGYYNRMTYLVSLSATNLISSNVSAMQGNISIHTSTPARLGLAPAGNQINDCTKGNSNSCAAVVALISHGNNGFGAYSESGVQRALPSGKDELENANADDKLIMHDYVSDGANPYDDIILPLTPSNMLSSLQNIGALENTNSLLNKDFAIAETFIVTAAVASNSGSPAQYTLPQAIDLPTTTDPWGINLKYVIDNNSPPFIDNTTRNIHLYDIISSGPDKKFNTADDIVKSINSGVIMADINKNVW